MIQLEEIAPAVAAETGLECSEADLRRILAAFMSGSSIWEAVGLAGRPFHLVQAVAMHLTGLGLLSSAEGKTHLTAEGVRLCESAGVTARRKHRCPDCEGRGISLEHFSQALERFRILATGRPDPLQEYDQAYVTPDTTIARLACMADRGDLVGKSLLVLGDDDLMGLAAALTGLPARVLVAEIDQRLTGFMREAALSEGLQLEVISHDLSLPLPEGLIASFDTFFTDPPDTQSGMRLFLSRGIECLRGAGTSGYFGLTMIESSLYRWRELQQFLVRDCGVVITDILPDFSTYENWDYLGDTLNERLGGLLSAPEAPWYRSALYRIELLPGAKPSLDGLDESQLYVAKESLAWTR